MRIILHFLYRHKWWISVYVVALLIRVGLALPLIHDWDGFVFFESAKKMLHGITPYQTVQSNSPIIYPDSDRPMLQQWYAYPPLPLILFTIPYGLLTFTGVHTAQFMQNFAIKLPFILGDLLCAYLVKNFLEGWNEKRAKQASLLILFNPLLIWISSAWGMFDVWIINFLLLFLLSVRFKRALLAGICLALAPQIKLFPLFFLPVLIFFFYQSIQQGNKRIYFLLSFVLTTLVIDVPFFLSSPQGFMNQNLLMHLARPPQGIGILGMIDYLAYIYGFNISFFVSLGGLFTLGSIGLFTLFSFAFVQGKESKLLTVILLIYTSILLFNKVVNEQYYVVLICLLILLIYHPEREVGIFHNRFLHVFEGCTTFSALIASVVLGFHFLTFLPPFLAEGVLKASIDNLVFYLSGLFPQLPLYTYPNSLWTYYNMPVTLIYILLLPLIALTAYVVLRGYIEVFRMGKEIKNVLISPLLMPKLAVSHALKFVVALLLLVSLSLPFVSLFKPTNALKLVDLVDKNSVLASSMPSTKPRVGTFYDVWWNNPSHIPSFADDVWSKTTLTPQVGYYTSKNSYFVRHIRQMKAAGIDFAIVSYHIYDRERFLTFSKYAEQLRFTYAPMIESDDALGAVEFRPITPFGNQTVGYKISPAAQAHMENTIISSLVEVKNNQGLLRINGKPVVFIYDGHFYFPSWDAASKRALAQRVYQKYATMSAIPYIALSKAWRVPIRSLDDIVAQYPLDIPTFNNRGFFNGHKRPYKVSNDDYRQAFFEEYIEYWKNIKAEVEAKVGPIYLLSTYQTPLVKEANSLIRPGDLTQFNCFDNEFYYSLSNTWSYWRRAKKPEDIMRLWEKQEADQANRDRARGWPVFLTVTPTYNDTKVRGQLGFKIPATFDGKNIYESTWQTAIKNKADYILIASWNEFFEGSAIEPSKEHGAYYLNLTTQFIQTFQHGQQGSFGTGKCVKLASDFPGQSQKKKEKQCFRYSMRARGPPKNGTSAL